MNKPLYQLQLFRTFHLIHSVNQSFASYPLCRITPLLCAARSLCISFWDVIKDSIQAADLVYFAHIVQNIWYIFLLCHFPLPPLQTPFYYVVVISHMPCGAYSLITWSKNSCRLLSSFFQILISVIITWIEFSQIRSSHFNPSSATLLVYMVGDRLPWRQFTSRKSALEIESLSSVAAPMSSTIRITASQ